jgi:hypothetical protein
MTRFCSVCGRLWGRHQYGDVLACVKALERRSDKREVTKRFLPQLAKSHREVRFQRALQYRSKRGG